MEPASGVLFFDRNLLEHGKFFAHPPVSSSFGV